MWDSAMKTLEKQDMPMAHVFGQDEREQGAEIEQFDHRKRLVSEAKAFARAFDDKSGLQEKLAERRKELLRSAANDDHRPCVTQKARSTAQRTRKTTTP